MNLIGIILALITSLAGAIQTFRSYHADKTRGGRSRTVVLGALVVVGSVLAAIYQAKSTAALKGLVNTQVQFRYDFEQTPFDSSGNTTLIVFERAIPNNNVAKDLHVFVVDSQARSFGFKALPNLSNETDQAAWKGFMKMFRGNRDKVNGFDIGLGLDYRVLDQRIQLSRQDLDDMKNFRLRIYLVSGAWWKNVSGSHDAATECVFLGSDAAADKDPYKISPQPILHTCPSSPDAIL